MGLPLEATRVGQDIESRLERIENLVRMLDSILQADEVVLQGIEAQIRRVWDQGHSVEAKLDRLAVIVDMVDQLKEQGIPGLLAGFGG